MHQVLNSCWVVGVYFLTFVISAHAEGGKRSGSCQRLLDDRDLSTYWLEGWAGHDGEKIMATGNRGPVFHVWPTTSYSIDLSNQAQQLKYILGKYISVLGTGTGLNPATHT